MWTSTQRSWCSETDSRYPKLHPPELLRVAEEALSPRLVKKHNDLLHWLQPNPFEEGRLLMEAGWERGRMELAKRLVWC